MLFESCDLCIRHADDSHMPGLDLVLVLPTSMDLPSKDDVNLVLSDFFAGSDGVNSLLDCKLR